MGVILHLGAHRTGSTAIEQALAAHAPALMQAGVWVMGARALRAVPIWDNPPGFSTKMLDDPAAFAALGQQVEAFTAMLARAPAPDIILSDENMIGTMGRNLSRGVFYPDARQRLEKYAQLLPAPPTRIGLGVRHYASWWLSMQAYKLRGRDMPPLNLIAPRITAPRKRGWTALVADIRHVFPHARILVWPQERLAGHEHQIVAALAGINPETLGARPGRRARVNASLPVDRIPLAHALRAAQPHITARAFARAIAAAPAPNLPYRPFSPEGLEVLDRRYAHDMAAFAAGEMGVRLLQGPPR